MDAIEAQKNVRRETGREIFNFRQIWLLSFLLTSFFAIVPLIFFAVIDYNVTRKSVESEAVLRISSFASNTWRSVAYFLDERKAALAFSVYERSFKELSDMKRLSKVLENLRKAFGGFTDLGVIDAQGFQQAYVGPYNLIGKNYKGQAWFDEVMEKGSYISEVFLGYRNVPHLVIAIKHYQSDGAVFVLRATIEQQFTELLAQTKKFEKGDTFLINAKGVLQTPSVFFGDVLKTIPFELSHEDNQQTLVIDIVDRNDVPMMIGYRYIPDTPFILMVVNHKASFMEPWQRSRKDLIRYLVISITVVLLWIWGLTTYLIRRMKHTERRGIRYFHMAEYSNKMATIGRLSAGVAHEINNPLAIINEKAGLIADLFNFNPEYKQNPKLMDTINSILNSVERCSRITRQLLSFARHLNLSIQTIRLGDVVNEVLGFLNKEAQYRSIDVNVDIAGDIPEFECDRGKLQQVLLNIINNAFAALSTGGWIKIKAQLHKQTTIKIDISDNGCGIPAANLKYIFEPFFSTKMASGGTGLGLSITYGLVEELGGRIDVASEVDKGTSFSIYLPLKYKTRISGKKEGEHLECTPGR